MSIFNFITQKPKLSLIAIVLLLITALMGSSNFKLDASSETLLLENDPDLKLYRDSIDTYGSTDFLVVTVTPFKSIFEWHRSYIIYYFKHFSKDYGIFFNTF